MRIVDLHGRIAGAALLCVPLALYLVASCGGGTSALAPTDAGRPCGQGTCVSTLAGSGEFGTADGPVQAAQFFMPHAIALDEMSQLHVADFGANNGTRLIAAGTVTTLPEDAIDFPHPADAATDATGNRYLADAYGNRILKVAPDGTTTVLAGTGQAGDQDGDGASASFSLPSGIALDAAGALYVADMGNHKIRKITLQPASQSS
jgi:DNA-binding beta-propeller fold protein YncE